MRTKIKNAESLGKHDVHVLTPKSFRVAIKSSLQIFSSGLYVKGKRTRSVPPSQLRVTPQSRTGSDLGLSALKAPSVKWGLVSTLETASLGQDNPHQAAHFTRSVSAGRAAAVPVGALSHQTSHSSGPGPAPLQRGAG